MKKRIYIIIFGFSLILLIGLIDSWVDYRVSFSIFYVIPVVLVTWYTKLKEGIFFSILSSLMWLAAEVISRNHQLPMPILFWNSGVRLGFFIIITLVLHYFKSERENARLDFLTKIPNRRQFEEVLQMEAQRGERYGHPLTLIYMDIDNFKVVNDSLGHHEGDRLLVAASSVIKRSIRSTDFVSRLGGDEFSLIMIETNEQQARSIVNKLNDDLLHAMEKRSWPVTFSFGIVSFYRYPKTVREMIRMADASMYNAKRGGKNIIKTKVIR